MRKALFVALFAITLLFPMRSAGSKEYERVDLLLVLAIDISTSVSDSRFEVEKYGYIEAFSDHEVISTITSGEIGAVAIAVVQWGGVDQHYEAISWYVIHDEASAQTFVYTLEAMGRMGKYDSTRIAEALEFSIGLLEEAPYRAPRKVIDISGDGKCMSAFFELLAARVHAMSKNITVNGLPIMNEDEEAMDEYYRENVIAGENAFVVVVEDPDDREAFAEAIKRKLIQEIAIAQQ